MPATPDLPPAPGEATRERIREIVDIALRLCDGCARDHIDFAARRVLFPVDWPMTDADRIVAILRACFARLTANAPLHVAIAGAADDGLLRVCARAAHTADFAPRFEATVVDRCRTPLELSRRFADRRGIRLHTRLSTLPRDLDDPADIVLVHSLFRHVPRDGHDALLRSLMGWLRPGGRLVFSQVLHTGLRPSRAGRGIARQLAEDADWLGAARRVRLAEGLARGAPHTRSKIDFPDAASVRALFDPGVAEVEAEEQVPDAVLPDGGVNRSRYLAVLKTPGADR